jgi:hypothetical protein
MNTTSPGRFIFRTGPLAGAIAGVFLLTAGAVAQDVFNSNGGPPPDVYNGTGPGGGPDIFGSNGSNVRFPNHTNPNPRGCGSPIQGRFLHTQGSIIACVRTFNPCRNVTVQVAREGSPASHGYAPGSVVTFTQFDWATGVPRAIPAGTKVKIDVAVNESGVHYFSGIRPFNPALDEDLPIAERTPEAVAGCPAATDNSGPPITRAAPTLVHADFPVVDYVRGMGDGLHDCVDQLTNLPATFYKETIDFFGAAASIVRGDFVTGAKLLGFTTSDTALRAIFQPLTTQQIVIDPKTGKPSISAYDVGRNGGLRLCQYGIAHAAAKALKALGSAGETPLNPLKGNALTTAMGGAEDQLPNLSGKYVSTPNGPAKLGKFVGKGSFSTVYEMGDDPSKVIKIGNNPTESQASFARQVVGAERLKASGVKTPKIHNPDTAGRSGVLITDNVNKLQLGPITQYRNILQMKGTPAERAMLDMGNKLNSRGYALVDNHAGNVSFIPNGAGTLEALVVDPDMVMTVPEMQEAIQQNTIPGNVIKGVLGVNGGEVLQALQNGTPITPNEVFTALLQARGLIPKGGGSTVIPAR